MNLQSGRRAKTHRGYTHSAKNSLTDAQKELIVTRYYRPLNTSKKTNVNASVFNPNMTLNQDAFRPSKKILPTPKGPYKEYTGPEKKHYETQKPNPIIFGGLESKKQKEKNLKEWKPSIYLLTFNNKHTNYFVDNPRTRKEIPGESLYRSSIMNMIGMDEEIKPAIKKQGGYYEDMKDVITYKNGPRFRDSKIPDSIPRTNPAKWSRIDGLTKESNIRSVEYETNRLRARGSQIAI